MTTAMKWLSIVMLLLSVLPVPIASSQVFVAIVVCASGLLLVRQAVRAGKYSWAVVFTVIAALFNPVVLVQGAVNSPVAVTYAPGKSLEYYIRAAGGPTVRADVKRAYVFQPNGKLEARQSHFLLPDGIPTPEPGSTVVVPNRDPLDKPIDYLASIGTITQILTGLVAFIIAVRH